MPLLYNYLPSSYYFNTQQSTGALIAGNATTTMNTTGLTVLSAVSGIDDGFGVIPINFDFYFFGTNYGNGLNSGIYWNTNNVIGFGPGNGTITWVANTGRGILLGNVDRRTNTFYYSSTQTSSGYSFITCLLFAQNIYNDGVPNAVQFQIRIFRGSSYQYIEIRCKQAASTAGAFNITNGTTFQNTYGAYSNMVANQSFVLQSDLNGNNWTFFNNYYVNI
jgi:hypothetical protein